MKSDLGPDQIRELVARLETRSWREQEEPWSQLLPLGEKVVAYLLEAYPRTLLWQGRASLGYHATRFARTSNAAFELGLAALTDRSFMVRYRACGLLAYSLRADAQAPLEKAAEHEDERTQEDATGALLAIGERNHHLFRDKTGRMRWVVNPEDRPGYESPQ